MAIDAFVGIQPNGRAIFYGTAPPAAAGDIAAAPQPGDILEYASAAPAGGNPARWMCVDAAPAGIGTWVNVMAIQKLNFTLTNTQTKALNSAPTDLVAAPGAGKLIEVVSCVLTNVFGTAAFANGGVIGLYYGAAALLASSTAAATFLTSPAANQVILLTGAMASVLEATVVNAKLQIACATADFITGAGFIKGQLLYRVRTLP